jgi:hypothetical protein
MLALFSIIISLIASPVAATPIWAQISGGQIVALYRVPQTFPVTQKDDSAADVLAFQAALAAASNPTVSISSTSFGSALNGAYSISQPQLANMNAEASYLMANGSGGALSSTFSNGAPTLAWIDPNGNHTFPSPVEFIAFSSAVARYVTATQLYQAGQGSQPSNSITIP